MIAPQGRHNVKCDRLTRRQRLAFALLVATTLATLGPLAAVRASDRWPEERVAGSFVFHADFSLKPYQSLLSQMTDLQADLIRELEIGTAREPVHLFLFSRTATYKSYLGQYFPKVPYRRALFIKERGPGMVFAYRSPDFETDVRHESTHALLHAALPMVPLWLDEGLAEYFEVPADKRAYENPHLATMKWQVWLPSVRSFEDLENVGDLNQMGGKEYRDSWAWVHFMLHGSSDAREELVRFLADIEAQTPPGKLGDRLRRRIPDVERQFAEHFKRWK